MNNQKTNNSSISGSFYKRPQDIKDWTLIKTAPVTQEIAKQLNPVNSFNCAAVKFLDGKSYAMHGSEDTSVCLHINDYTDSDNPTVELYSRYPESDTPMAITLSNLMHLTEELLGHSEYSFFDSTEALEIEGCAVTEPLSDKQVFYYKAKTVLQEALILLSYLRNGNDLNIEDFGTECLNYPKIIVKDPMRENIISRMSLSQFHAVVQNHSTNVEYLSKLLIS